MRPRSPMSSAISSPMRGDACDAIIAPDADMLINRTACLVPRSSSVAACEPVASRGSERSSNIRRTLRGIIEPLSMVVPAGPLAFILKLSHGNLRIGSFRTDDSRTSVARVSLARAVQPVYGFVGTGGCWRAGASGLQTKGFQGMNVRFKSLLIFTALTAPAGLAIAQTGVPAARPPAPAPAPVAAQPQAVPGQP